MAKKIVSVEEMQANPISTEELKERIRKMKEYREKMKKNPPETLPPKKVPSKTEIITMKIDKAMEKISKKFDTIMLKFFKVFSRFLLGAVIWVILGHFVPEFHEKIPSVYEIIDAFFWAVNEIVDFGLDGLKSIFGFLF